eukprot:1569942-Rhodomonas_salina.1
MTNSTPRLVVIPFLSKAAISLRPSIVVMKVTGCPCLSGFSLRTVKTSTENRLPEVRFLPSATICTLSSGNRRDTNSSTGW